MKRPRKPELLAQIEMPKRQIKRNTIETQRFIFSVNRTHSEYINMCSSMAIELRFELEKQVFIVDLYEFQPEATVIRSPSMLLAFIRAWNSTGGKMINEPASRAKQVLEFTDLAQKEALAWRILSMRSENTKIKYISLALGITESQVKNIIRKTKKSEGTLIYKKTTRTQQNELLKHELTSYLEETEQPAKTLKEIRENVLSRLSTDAAKPSLSKISRLVYRLGYRRKKLQKVPIARNSIEVIRQRCEKIKLIADLKADGKKFIFLDETGFSTSTVPSYGYGKKGVRLKQIVRPKTINHSVIAAITQERFLGYQVFRGSCTANEFAAFIASLLQKNPEIKLDMQNYVFVLDNAPIHKAKTIKMFLSFLNIFYLPPYSPFLNPIEEVFSLWKHNFRSLIQGNSWNVLKTISLSAQAVTAQKIQKFYQHSLTFYESTLQQNPI